MTDHTLWARLYHVAQTLPPKTGEPLGNSKSTVEMKDGDVIMDAVERGQAVVMSRETFDWMIDYITRLRKISILIDNERAHGSRD